MVDSAANPIDREIENHADDAIEMPYSTFNLRKVKQDFDLTILEESSFLEEIQPIAPSSFLTQVLAETLPLAIALGTEKARSEMIICPVLIEVRKLLKQEVSLFSGEDFTVDSASGLNGVCDFLISRSPQQLFIEAPAIVVVEAKQDNLKSGLGQCVAEMIAAQKFNQQNNQPIPVIYGTVTSGTDWQFLKLEGKTVTIGLEQYSLPPADRILGILVQLISDSSIS